MANSTALKKSTHWEAVALMDHLSVHAHLCGNGNDVETCLSSMEDRCACENEAERQFPKLCCSCPSSLKCVFSSDEAVPDFVKTVRDAKLDSGVALSLVDMCAEKRTKLKAVFAAELKALATVPPKFVIVSGGDDDLERNVSARVVHALRAPNIEPMRKCAVRYHGANHKVFFDGVPVRGLRV